MCDFLKITQLHSFPCFLRFEFALQPYITLIMLIELEYRWMPVLGENKLHKTKCQNIAVISRLQSINCQLFVLIL